MNEDALKTFITIAEVKNFTKASEILHISQPSVSLQVKNLEKEFGTELFIRSPKHVQITPTGEILYKRAKQLRSLYEQTKEEIVAYHHKIQGVLVIGASFTIGEFILPSLLKKVQDFYPELELQIIIGNTEEIIEKVRMFQVDIGLIEGQTNDTELQIQPFMEDELVLISSPTHMCLEECVDIHELHDQQWIIREDGSGTNEYVKHFIRTNGLKVKRLMTISSNQGIKESVINGMGISLLSSYVVERERKHGELAVTRVKNKPFTRTLSYIYTPIGKTKKSVTAFMEIIDSM
ncbi:LysR family transcriptional regulator [Gracilibacillus marinus]|uniref:LysR family transcriptional regulator n=1 Tax=Gracilibacillus marinus TaxID=630535 RepID=A0ABV8VYA9_9BACI